MGSLDGWNVTHSKQEYVQPWRHIYAERSVPRKPGQPVQALLTLPKPSGGYRRPALRAQALQEPLARLTQRSERVPSRAFRELEITNIGSKPQPESGTDRHHDHQAIAGR